MSFLFESGEEETSNTQDNWSDLPQFMKDFYRKDTATAEKIGNRAEDLGNWLYKNEAHFADMSPEEIAAYEGMMGQVDESQGMIDGSLDILGLSDKYENAYTDDVVNTTLERMQREADREQAERGASAASIGGLNSTRAAVADAVAENLHGMSQAEMEAKLRSQAFDTSVNYGFNESGVMRDAAGQALDTEMAGANFGTMFGEKSRQIEEAQKNAKRNAKKEGLSTWADLFASSRGAQTPGVSTSTQVTPTASPIQQAASAGLSAASMWSQMGSDERMKEDIEPSSGALDKLAKLKSHDYRYRKGLGDGRTHRRAGLMAGDVRRSGIEGGVIDDHPSGYDHVDPYAILSTVVDAVNEINDRDKARGIA